MIALTRRRRLITTPLSNGNGHCKTKKKHGNYRRRRSAMEVALFCCENADWQATFSVVFLSVKRCFFLWDIGWKRRQRGESETTRASGTRSSGPSRGWISALRAAAGSGRRGDGRGGDYLYFFFSFLEKSAARVAVNPPCATPAPWPLVFFCSSSSFFFCFLPGKRRKGILRVYFFCPPFEEDFFIFFGG